MLYKFKTEHKSRAAIINLMGWAGRNNAHGLDLNRDLGYDTESHDAKKENSGKPKQ